MSEIEIGLVKIQSYPKPNFDLNDRNVPLTYSQMVSLTIFFFFFLLLLS